MVAIRWGRKNGVPLVMMSETQADDAARSSFREGIKKRIVSQCDAALVGGPSQARYMAQLGIPEGRTHMGYNAVDNAYFARGAAQARADDAALRARHGLPARYILASCRFIAKKNLPALVSAFADAVAATEGETPDLVILGDGEMRPAIEQAADEDHVASRVHLPGWRTYDDLPAHYALAELFAHVSTVEQWGLVINEAMASGTPVLASEPCGATRTLLRDGVSGLVVEPTREAIAAALLRFFAMSDAERRAMGEAAAGDVADWGPARFGAGMKAAVASALAAPRRGSLGLLDKAIFSRLERTIVEDVA